MSGNDRLKRHLTRTHGQKAPDKWCYDFYFTRPLTGVWGWGVDAGARRKVLKSNSPVIPLGLHVWHSNLLKMN